MDLKGGAERLAKIKTGAYKAVWKLWVEGRVPPTIKQTTAQQQQQQLQLQQQQQQLQQQQQKQKQKR